MKIADKTRVLYNNRKAVSISDWFWKFYQSIFVFLIQKCKPVSLNNNMASGRRKKFMEVESNRNLFEFFTRNESENNPAKIVRSILSVMVSESVDKAEKVLSV